MEISREIWEGRKALLEKARVNELSFREFCLLDMHEETKDLLNPNGGLSEKGIATLCAIETYLGEEVSL